MINNVYVLYILQGMSKEKPVFVTMDNDDDDDSEHSVVTVE